MGPLHDPVTWYGINYAGMQVTQWDFQTKGKSGWTGKSTFVLKVPLRYLRRSIIYSEPCDRIFRWHRNWRRAESFKDQLALIENPGHDIPPLEDFLQFLIFIHVHQVNKLNNSFLQLLSSTKILQSDWLIPRVTAVRIFPSEIRARTAPKFSTLGDTFGTFVAICQRKM